MNDMTEELKEIKKNVLSTQLKRIKLENFNKKVIVFFRLAFLILIIVNVFVLISVNYLSKQDTLAQTAQAESLKQIEALKTCTQKVKKARKNNAENFFEKAMICEDKNTAKSIEYYKKAIALNPEYYQAHYNLGIIYKKQGKKKEADLHLSKYIEYEKVLEKEEKESSSPRSGIKVTTDHKREYYDLLLLGIDRRGNGLGRSDAISLIHCEPNSITIVSVPRDTLVRINGEYPQKINHAYMLGGRDLALRIIQNFLWTRVDNYVEIDFKTLRKTLSVIKTMTLDGKLIGADNFFVNTENLIKWVTYRSFPSGDMRRCQRHQLFIQRILSYAQKLYKKHPFVFENIVRITFKIFKTDLTVKHVKGLLEIYKDYDLDKMEKFVIFGRTKKLLNKKVNMKLYYLEASVPHHIPYMLKYYRSQNKHSNYKVKDTLRK